MTKTRKYALLAAAIFGTVLLLTPQGSGASYYTPVRGGGYAQIAELAGAIEQRAQLPGFTAFALGVAERESNGNNLSVNDSRTEAAAACSLYKGNWRYKKNPYPAKRFCFGSGGWYGFLPATGLAGEFFRNADPYLVFDPVASTVMLADFARRVANGYWSKIPYEHRNWLTVRRFMSSNRTGLDWREEGDAARRVRENFARELRQRGYDPNVMFEHVSFASWPGTAQLYAWLVAAKEAA